jgi:phenylacetate-CoA ligase
VIEKWYRSKAGELQLVYDRMPSFVRSGLTSVRGWALARNRYAPGAFRTLDELVSNERSTPEQIERRQVKSLQRLLDLARQNCPFYEDYPSLRIESVSDWSRLPILSRADVRENASAMISRAIPLRERILVATTGTTGSSLKVCYTTAIMRKNWAFRMQQFLWACVKPRTPRITAFGNRVVPPHRKTPPYWIHNVAERQTFISIFHLSPATAPEYIRFLKKHEGSVLEGFPSVLTILADFILAAGEPIHMRALFTDGEPLHSFLREKLESAFATKLFNTYGNTEMCGLIQQCEQGGMHLNPDYAFLEVLDDNHQPVPPGETGYLVWTGFVNESMPFIRYKIGDRGAWDVSQRCTCGRCSPLVDPGMTRESDLLYSADGRVFSPRSVNQVLKGTTAFRFCQFVQQKPGQVLVRAVGSGEQAERELRKVQTEIVSLLGRDSVVETELASAPIMRSGGKTPLVLQEVGRAQVDVAVHA